MLICLVRLYRAIHFVVSEVGKWNSTSVKLSCETNFFLFGESLTLTKMDLLNYHTTHKNDQNRLQKW